MRKFMRVGESVAVLCLLLSAVPAAAQFVGPPPPGTIRFTDAQAINRDAALEGLFNAPVRDPTGTTLGYFRRIELHDGVQPVGIVTLKDYNRTVAVPLERLRFYQPGRSVLTDMSWLEMNYLPSGRRPSESPYYPFGRPATG